MSAQETDTKPETSVSAESAEGRQSLRRRGMLAALWAVAAGFFVKETTQPVEASTQMLIANSETAGFLNTVVGHSGLIGSGSSTDAVLVGDSGVGSAKAGVMGTTLAEYNPTEFSAVYGRSNSANAVFGNATNGIGVKGSSGGTYGVLGTVPSTSGSNAVAVCGTNLSSYVGPSPGAGGFGVYGFSSLGHGLVGATSTAGGGAVVGATNGVAGAYAGVFYGPVIVAGSFAVVNGTKSAAVAHPDGQHRLLYCFEAPESWFEDLGEARLTNGDAEVTFDPEFARLVDTEHYHVFLTEYDDQHGLYVRERTSRGFKVRAKDDCPDAASFSWRVVARRTDVPSERFAKMTVPPEPALPQAPPPPVARPERR